MRLLWFVVCFKGIIPSVALNESDFVSDERMSKCPHRRVDRWETFGWSILLSPSHTLCGLDAVTKAVLEIWISVT